ncbi:hypothetical protein BJY04DRAFT_54492 [Aspergillus karnatakaensis]|uniref:uncharacterized protein n=1 Tax=Aspergillus karnatakaensis TaxID=1810916 RepID=UPI003CCD3E3A
MKFKLKLPSLTVLLAVLIIIVTGIALMYAGKTDIMSEAEAEECVDCVHYATRVESRFQKLQIPRDNLQFFGYALDKSCRGQMYLAGHCQKFRRAFRKDMKRYINDIQSPYDACASIKVCR